MDSNEKREYPRRMYEVVPQQNKSINHGCSLSIVRDVRKSVGDEVWEYLKNSALGVLILLAESNFCWHGKTVHYFLAHQLKIVSKSEIWCLIGEKPLRFSLHEFAQLSGLNCDPYSVEKEEEEAEIDHREIWAEMGVPISDGPSWEELAKVLKKCQTWTYEKKRIVGCLCILSLGIFGLSRGCRMDLKCAKKALDPAALERFPWGRRSFELLIQSIKEANLADNSYTLKGLVHVLQIWAYESFQKLGELYGRKKQEHELPILSWGGSRSRYEVDDTIVEEKKKHGQICFICHRLVVADLLLQSCCCLCRLL